MSRDGLDITLEQYHAGLEKLWGAVHLSTAQEDDIFTITARYIKQLEHENERLKDELFVCYGG